MGCASSRPTSPRKAHFTAPHKDGSLQVGSGVTLAADAGKPSAGPAVPHADAHAEQLQSNGRSQQHGSATLAAAQAESAQEGETPVVSASAVAAEGCSAPASQGAPAVQQPVHASAVAAEGRSAPASQGAPALQQPVHAGNGVQELQRQSQERQQRNADASGALDANTAASDTATMVTNHKYVDVITGEDGASTVMLRADAGSAAAGFIGAPVLPEDSTRCELTRSLHTGGAPSAERQDPRFDSITKLMASIFNMPVALVVFIDSNFCYIKSGVGMDQYEPTERHMSFCTWTLVPVNPEMLVIHDTTKDGRFASHPYVKGEPGIRFYAGAPLVASNGHRLGTMCIVDYKPRKFDAECCNILANFAEMVVRDTERYAAAEQRAGLQQQNPLTQPAVEQDLVRVIHGKDDGYILCNPQLEGWPMLFANDAWQAVADAGSSAGKRFWDVFEPAHARDGSAQEDPAEPYQDAIRHGGGFLVQARRRGEARSSPVLTIVFRPAALDKLDKDMVNVNIPAIPSKAEDQNPTAYYFGMIRQITTGSAESLAASLDEEERVPFDDIILGGLLGKGSFGNVYFGVWQKASDRAVDVAVKVIEHKITAAEKDVIKQELEATVGMQLDHPNVVHTLKHTTRLMSRPRDLIRSWKDFQTSGSLPRPSADGLPGNERPSSGHGSASTLGPGMSEQSSQRGSSQADGGSTVRVSSDFTRGGASRRCETWIVLELCSLGSMQGAIDGGAFRVTGSVYDGLPDLPTILLTALEVARALEYLHGKNILHGDLTANNILLVDAAEDDIRNFSAKVSDFGLSRVAPSETAISTNTCGTITHMPPELINEGKMSKAVDVYGFGVLLWELYVGERPWAGLRPVQIILKKTTGRANLAFPPGTPAAYKDVAEACMQPDPAVRPTFSKLVIELSALLEAANAGIIQPGEAFAIYQQWSSGGACVAQLSSSQPSAYLSGI